MEHRPPDPVASRTSRDLATLLIGGIPLAVLAVLATQAHAWAALLAVPTAMALALRWELRRDARASGERALEAFANIVDERDHYTAEHSQRVCDLSMIIARHMGIRGKALDRVYWTSRLHDLGKIAVDGAILNKPGRLTDEEFEIIKQHPVVSSRVLGAFSFRKRDSEIVLCHHERFDGRGYLGRTPDDVPMESFIIAVADTYDAMTSDRPYREALPNEVALQEIARNIGTQFHPVPAQAFLEAMGWPDIKMPQETDVGERGKVFVLHTPAGAGEQRKAA